MAQFGIEAKFKGTYDEALAKLPGALKTEGFGVLTEIDVKATMKAKLDADMEDYVILGACNPALAHRALAADRSIGLLLPCNVVVRSAGDNTSTVEMLDPAVMSQVSQAPGLDDIAAQAAQKLRSALAALS